MRAIEPSRVAGVFTRDEISEVKTLTELDDYIDQHVAQDDRLASMAKHATASEVKGRGGRLTRRRNRASSWPRARCLPRSGHADGAPCQRG